MALQGRGYSEKNLPEQIDRGKEREKE